MSTARVRRPKKARLGRHSNGMLMTPEEFDAATDFDELYCYELIHGVLIVSPPPGESERDPNEELGHLLRAYQSGHEAGSALDKTLGAVCPPLRQPPLGGSRDLGQSGSNPGSENRCSSNRGRVRLQSAPRPGAGLRGEAPAVSGHRGSGILDHRSVPANHDGLPRPAGGASRTDHQRERGLSHDALDRIRASSGPALEGGRRLGRTRQSTEEQWEHPRLNTPVTNAMLGMFPRDSAGVPRIGCLEGTLSRAELP